MIESFTLQSLGKEDLIDITDTVNTIVTRSQVTDGICCIYTPHTTAAITINENADPSVRRDILKGLSHLKFEQVSFSHAEGNSPAHCKSSLIGCSEMVFIDGGRLNLGTWQGIYFCEFDGPRTRKVLVKIIG
ncbi:MAG: hypothetical protein A2176_02685 [Spirochaetes bacterium RBG_13_51_14]|nr:MAG: hypothetical protein A2176_02685 [Spirochaetes bacterium RBG_13_51_14]